jgi:hypothetical protein
VIIIKLDSSINKVIAICVIERDVLKFKLALPR